MMRRCLIVVGLLCQLGSAAATAAAGKPNVLVILADDKWEELG